MNLDKNKVNEYLISIIGKPFNYGFKTSNMELYDLGFGSDVICTDYKGMRTIPEYSIHCIAGIVIYSKKGRIEYDGRTSKTRFESDISPFTGLLVRKIKLSDKNDLWIDLGKCQIVIVTEEDDEESWRLLSANPNYHLVVSSTWISLE